MGGKSKPKTPNYEAAAEATAASDREMLEYQTQANRPDQNTPFGQVRWSQDEAGNWTQDTTLNEESQRALDAELGLTADRSEMGRNMFGRVGDELGESIDWDQFSEVGTGAGARDRAEQAIYDRSASRLDPQWEQATSQMEAKLAAQGLRPGDKAYDQAMENQGRAKTDAYDRATQSSIIGGGAEADRQYNLESSDRNRQIAEVMQQRGFSLNEINALISGQQTNMPGMPGFTSAGRGAGVDYTGAAAATGQGSADRASASNANMQGLMQGGMALAMMSDRRLKRNITVIGSFKQYPLYLFQYIWGKWAVGVMADEVNQDAVTRLPSGYDMVDLARVK